MIENIFSNAELSLAAYSNLESGSLIPQQAELIQDGNSLSQMQAEKFASEYSVVTQYNDTDTSFSATVFKDAAGNLSVAFRGTREFVGDIVKTDADICSYGAGYDQIVAMYNWWNRVSVAAGQAVPQYGLKSFIDGEQLPAGAVPLYRVDQGLKGDRFI